MAARPPRPRRPLTGRAGRRGPAPPRIVGSGALSGALVRPATAAQLLPAALTGAALPAASDLLALHLPVAMPVGVVTGVLGGVYLAWLLSSTARKGTT
ncbi:iron chelate uptake ABC transporter family permease subunit [Actinomadura welshii]